MSVYVGFYRFRTISDSHQFLREGGSLTNCPIGWHWVDGYMYRV